MLNLRRMPPEARIDFERHKAAEVLSSMSDPTSTFLAQKVREGKADVSWSLICPGTMRLIVEYRGRTWSIRAPGLQL
jgi:hypothetical protein